MTYDEAQERVYELYRQREALREEMDALGGKYEVAMSEYRDLLTMFPTLKSKPQWSLRREKGQERESGEGVFESDGVTWTKATWRQQRDWWAEKCKEAWAFRDELALRLEATHKEIERLNAQPSERESGDGAAKGQERVADDQVTEVLRSLDDSIQKLESVVLRKAKGQEPR